MKQKLKMLKLIALQEAQMQEALVEEETAALIKMSSLETELKEYQTLINQKTHIPL